MSRAPMSRKISVKLIFILTFFHDFYRTCICEISSLTIFPWSRLLNAACSTNDWGFWRPYNVVAKFSPIFKGPDVLPQRFPNFGKTNNLVSLTAKLSCYARNLWIKFLWEKKYFSPLVFGVRWQDFLLSSDPFSFEGNESELHFY